jgi:Uma2 family endonuclease
MSTQELRYDWTYSDYARLPDDGNRYEVIDGELLVTPSPSPLHQRVAFRLAAALDPFVERHALGLVIPNVDLLFQTGQFLRPDLLVAPVSSREGITNRGVETAPLLVIEILSPTSGAIDRVKKPARYGAFGIPEYWVLDPEERCAWVWRFAEGAAAPEKVVGALEWRAAGAPEALVIDLEKVLAPLWGELPKRSER